MEMNTSASWKADLALHQACKTADEQGLKQLIETGANIDKVVGPSEETSHSLTTATNTGSLSLVKLLLDHGVTPQIGAIRAAATSGDVPMLQLLLKLIKNDFFEPKPGFSEKRWRNDLAGVLCDTMISGQAATAEMLMVFKDRLRNKTNFDNTLGPGFAAAVARRDLNSIEVFLNWGAKDLPEVLKIVADQGQLDLLQSLIESESFETNQWSSALPGVAKAGDTITLQLLVGRGAKDHGNALNSAAQHSQTAMIVCLSQHFRYPSKSLSDAMSISASNGDTASMRVLIDIGAEPGCALVEAAKDGRVEAMSLLLDSFKHNPEVLSNAFVEAMFTWVRIQQAYPEILLRQNKFDRLEPLYSRCCQAVRMLQAAGCKLPEMRYLQILELLILLGDEHGAQLLLENRSEYTTVQNIPDEHLLALAIYHRRTSLVPLLIEYPLVNPGAVPSDEVEKSSIIPIPANPIVSSLKPSPTPLLAAIMVRDYELCEHLLFLTSDNVKTWCDYKIGKSPNSYYGHYQPCGEFECLKYPFGDQPFSHGPLTMAIDLGDELIVGLLLNRGASPWNTRNGVSTFECAVRQNILSELIALIPEEPSSFVNRKELFKGKTVLHWAAEYGDKDPSLLGKLISQGGDVNMRSNANVTSLHCAIAAGSWRAVEQLCWAGASVTSTTYITSRDLDFSGTIVEYAAWYPENQASDEPEEIKEVRKQILEFLQTWEKSSMTSNLDVDNIKKHYEEVLAAGAKNGKAGDKSHEAEDGISQFGDDDDESLHLSDDEEEQDEPADEDLTEDLTEDDWEMVDENPEEL